MLRLYTGLGPKRLVMIFSFYDASLKRHNVERWEALQSLEDPLRVEVVEGQSVDGNPTSIWVGMTANARLLEVGVEYLEDCNHIFHADNCRSHFKAMYYSSSRR